MFTEGPGYTVYLVTGRSAYKSIRLHDLSFFSYTKVTPSLNIVLWSVWSEADILKCVGEATEITLRIDLSVGKSTCRRNDDWAKL